MKKYYIKPEVEFVMFDDKEGFIVTCSTDGCTGCYQLECTPSDCYIASPSASSIVGPGVPAAGNDFTEVC